MKTYKATFLIVSMLLSLSVTCSVNAGTVKTVSDSDLSDKVLGLPNKKSQTSNEIMNEQVIPSKIPAVVKEAEDKPVSVLPEQDVSVPLSEAEAQDNQELSNESVIEENISEKAQVVHAAIPNETHNPKDQLPQTTLIEVLKLAHEFNPTIRAARAEMQSVEELKPQAFANFLPSAQAVGNISSVDNSESNFGNAEGSTSKSMTVELSQPIFKGGASISGVDRANLLIEAQNSLLDVAEQQLILDVATAYVDVLSNQALVQLAGNNKKVIAKQLQASKDRFEVGELTLTDVAQAESRLANAHAEYVQALAVLRSADAAYVRLTGHRPHNLVDPNFEFEFPDTLDMAIEKAKESNSEILAAIATYEAAKEDVDVNFAEHLPDLDLTGSWDRTFDPQPGLLDEQTTKSIGLTATIPLYQGGSVRSKIRESKYVANQRYIQIRETSFKVQQEVVAAWEDLHMTKAEIVSRHAQIKAARIAQEGVGYENELGVRTVLDVLDADQELLDAESSLVTARRNIVVSQFQLAKTLGILTPENLWLKAGRLNK